jgi:hypothetical protein
VGTGIGKPTNRRMLAVAAVLLGAIVVSFFWRSYSNSSSPEASLAPAFAKIPSVHAVGLSRDTLYHSPQTPGYTSWVGEWIMPDQSMDVAFVQATGPVDPSKRRLSPPSVFRPFGVSGFAPDRDFWGLKQEVKYMSSTDGGSTWQTYRNERFRAPGPSGYTPQATTALHDGTLIRRVNGDDLRSDPSIPHTAFLQRMAPGKTTWGPPQVLLDPARVTYQISRIRYLRDGRLIATGNVWDTPASTTPAARQQVPSHYLLMVSSDNGATWQNGLTIPSSTGPLPGVEWDVAQLADNSLVALMRTRDPAGNEVRKQAILVPHGGGWEMTDVKPAPFPPSGHPELLATQEGPVLSFATTGVSYTKDGRHWTKLQFSPRTAYQSNYYPRAVQSDDGTITVVGHVGGDDPYGAVNQRITIDQFRLAPDRRRTAAAR